MREILVYSAVVREIRGNLCVREILVYSAVVREIRGNRCEGDPRVQRSAGDPRGHAHGRSVG